VTRTRRNILSQACRGRRAAAPAFTLVELMVSIVLVLILIYGVNRVFKITADTVGATNVLAEKTREARAARQTFANDFNNAVTAGAPFIIIQSEHTYAFRNRGDFDGDRDGQPSSYDASGNGSETSISASDISFRSHRIDQLRFFTNYLLRRQTDDDGGSYASQTASSEAVITYGHLQLFDGSNSGAAGTVSGGDFYGPGEGTRVTNTNGYFASDWILGRSQLLLSPDASNGGSYIKRTPPPPPDANELSGSRAPNFSISPVALNSTDENNAFRVQSSRFDIGEGSMYDVWSGVSRFTDYNEIRQNPSPANEEKWWERMTYRFWANPYPSRPVDNLQAALSSPIFLRGCTQFNVEFAGDIGDQSGGQALPVPTALDGVIDYIVDANGTRRIRWYGFPRDVGSPTNNTTFKGGPDGKIQAAFDVVPMRDVLYPSGTVPNNFAEKKFPTSNIPPDYATALSAGAQYVVAFGPRDLEKQNYVGPKLIRITLVLDDPTSKLADGQTYEYIFKLGF
jgi:type II secretory pathway pseudopilin PulG